MAKGAMSPPTLLWGRLRRFDCGAACGGLSLDEAVQIEMQARVNQDPVVPHDSQRRPGLESASLPATAWPRQARGAALCGQDGGDEGRLLALSWGRPGVQVKASGFAVMCATQHHLSLRVGRGDYDPPLAGISGQGTVCSRPSRSISGGGLG